jgi:hypothetical protein
MPVPRHDLWACPNDPPCQHGSVLHDVDDWDDDRPMCCAEGCGCGKLVTVGKAPTDA